MVASIIITAICFYIVQASVDVDTQKRSIYPSHIRGTSIALLITGLLCIVHGMLIRFNIVELAVAYVCCFSARWVIYDFAFNWLSGNKLSYIGIPDQDDSKLDTFLLWFPKPHYTQYAIKSIPVCISIYLLIHYNII